MQKSDFEQILQFFPGKSELQREVDKTQWERQFCYIDFRGLHKNLQRKDWKLKFQEDDEDIWYKYIMFFIISREILGKKNKLLNNKKMLTVKLQKRAKMIIDNLMRFSNYERVIREFYDVDLELMQEIAKSGESLL